MNRTVKWLLALNLGAFAFLCFAYPDLMISPGALTPAHTELKTDCFACHSPFMGAAASRCTTCHKLSEIGEVTTKGVPLARRDALSPFHKKLKSADCMSCHTDHAGTRRVRSPMNFEHALLDEQTRTQCRSCHVPPRNAFHKRLTGECSQCHRDDQWKPATFDHAKFFMLDRDHNVECITCHVSNEYRQYTCYGCHEHSPQSIRDEHLEEGIRDFQNCAECHKSADEHDVRGRRTHDR